MAHKNPKFVRKKGIKVSIHSYRADAFEALYAETGIQAATLIHMLAFEPESSNVRVLRQRLFDIERQLVDTDQSTVSVA